MGRRKGGVIPSVQAAGRGIVIQIIGDGESARRALEMVEQHLRETGTTAEREASHIAESMERVTRALETVGLYMGVREAIDQLKELTAGSAEFGEQMQKASVRTGMSVESLSVLHYAADLAHTDFDQLQSGIGKMAVNLSSAAAGNTKLAAAFGQTGSNAKELSAQSDGVDVAFKRFVTTLANTENAQRRDALAKQLMGKAGVELVPVLMDIGSRFDELSSGAEQAGVKLDELRAERLARLDDELDKLKESITGAGLSFTDGLAPGLTRVFEIIGQGEGQLDTFKSWGEGVAHIVERLSALFYDLGAAAEFGFAMAEGGKFSESGRKDLAEYERFLAKGRELEELSLGKGPAPTAETQRRRTGPGAGAESGPAVKGATANSVAEALASLQQEQDKLLEAKRKAADQIQLAEVDAQHKMLLISDQEYFQRKLALQTDELDAEEAALDSRQQVLQKLYDKQVGDKTLKRKNGVSPEELKTQRELAQIEEQRQAIAVRRAQTTSASGAEQSAANLATEMASLRVAADLEKERNESISARQALLAYETDQAVKKSNASGGSEADASAIRQAADLQDKKLQLEQVSQRISEVEADYKRRVDDTNDAVTKGTLSKRAGSQDIQKLDADEARALQQLVAQYTELADSMGGEYKQKAADLGEELRKLGRRDESQDFTHKLSADLESMSSSIADSAARGKQSFSEMARSILDDIDRMALKMVEAKFMAPLFEGMAHSGSGGGTGAPTGSGGGFGAIFGGAAAAVPSIWKPPTPAASGSGAGSAVASIAKTAAGALTPNITHNIINNSSQAVSSDQPQVSYDSDMQQWVIDTILHDHDTGGPVSQLWNSNSGG